MSVNTSVTAFILFKLENTWKTAEYNILRHYYKILELFSVNILLAQKELHLHILSDHKCKI